ncbi:hypothetical protein D3C79_908540 [compost metagenome]
MVLVALSLAHSVLVGGDGEAVAIHQQQVELGPKTGQALGRLAKRVAPILGPRREPLQSAHGTRLARRKLPQHLPSAGVYAVGTGGPAQRPLDPAHWGISGQVTKLGQPSLCGRRIRAMR